MKTRIKQLRKTLKLNQTDFGKRLSVSQTAVASYESGARVPLETVISSICREFNVDENWLRTGEGEMFREISRRESLSVFFGELLSSGEPDFRHRFIEALSRFSPDDWKALELVHNKALELLRECEAEENKKADL